MVFSIDFFFFYYKAYIGSIAFIIKHSGDWTEDNCYIDYTAEAIMIKEYASYKDLVDEVANQIGIDLRYNKMKLKYKIELHLWRSTTIWE